LDLTWLASAAKGERELPEMTPDPELVARVERRIALLIPGGPLSDAT
jgi:hypothetical protein